MDDNYNPCDHVLAWQPLRPPSSPPPQDQAQLEQPAQRLDQPAQPQVDQVHEYYRSTYYVPPDYNPWSGPRLEGPPPPSYYNPWAHFSLGQPWQRPFQRERSPLPSPEPEPEPEYEIYPGIEGWRTVTALAFTRGLASRVRVRPTYSVLGRSSSHR